MVKAQKKPRAVANPYLARKKNIASMSTTKVKSFSPPTSVNPNKQDYTNWVTSIETAVPDFDVHWITKWQKKEEKDLPPVAAYIVPYIKEFDLTGDIIGSSNIKAFMPRRDLSKEGQFNLPTGSGKGYYWELLITERPSTDETAESMGRNIAKVFNRFSNIHDKNQEIFQFGGPRFGFKGEETANPPLPMNHYMCDNQCFVLLKELYSEDYSLENVMENDAILEQFFGSAEEGRRMLENLPEGNNVW